MTGLASGFVRILRGPSEGVVDEGAQQVNGDGEEGGGGYGSTLFRER